MKLLRIEDVLIKLSYLIISDRNNIALRKLFLRMSEKERSCPRGITL